MIIKEADSKQPQYDALQALLARPDITTDIHKRIETEIRNIRAGAKGEAEAAYEMGFHYGESKNWAIIHDLRIDIDGRIAQIDHLVINRLLEIYVCESKHFSEGLAINEHGEFTGFYAGKPYGVSSPIEQNRKHITVLEAAIRFRYIKPPTRLGFTLTPILKSLVLVSKNARISRPKVKLEGLDCIIKNDQFKAKIEKDIGNDRNPLTIAKLIGPETLEEFALSIVELHKPISFKWAAKFGLPETAPTAPEVTASIAPIEPESEASEEATKPKQKLICATCSDPVAYNVAKFCWFNKPKFGGEIYCMECQKAF